jgi:hypothetical protein
MVGPTVIVLAAGGIDHLAVAMTDQFAGKRGMINREACAERDKATEFTDRFDPGRVLLTYCMYSIQDSVREWLGTMQSLL